MAGTSNWETLTYLVLVELASRWWTGRAPGFIPLEIDPKQGLFRGLRKWFVTGSFLIPWSCPVSKPWRVKAPGYFWHSRAGRFWACSARSGSPRRSLSQRHPPATSVRGMRRPAIRRSRFVWCLSFLMKAQAPSLRTQTYFRLSRRTFFNETSKNSSVSNLDLKMLVPDYQYSNFKPLVPRAFSTFQTGGGRIGGGPGDDVA